MRIRAGYAIVQAQCFAAYAKHALSERSICSDCPCASEACHLCLPTDGPADGDVVVSGGCMDRRALVVEKGRGKDMDVTSDGLIRYDGHTLAVSRFALCEVQARRGRRWGWIGKKGWWVSLSFFRGWQCRKFVLTLAEAGIFLKDDPLVPTRWMNGETPVSGLNDPAAL